MSSIEPMPYVEGVLCVHSPAFPLSQSTLALEYDFQAIVFADGNIAHKCQDRNVQQSRMG